MELMYGPFNTSILHLGCLHNVLITLFLHQRSSAISIEFQLCPQGSKTRSLFLYLFFIFEKIIDLFSFEHKGLV